MAKSNLRGRVVAVTCVLLLAFGAVIFTTPVASTQNRPQLHEDLRAVLNIFDELTLDPASVHRQVRETGSFTLTTSRGSFAVELKPHDLRAPNYQAVARGDNGSTRVLERMPVRTYKGTVGAMDNAPARFTIDDSTIEGLIITPGELFFIEPSHRFSNAAGRSDFVFYAASAVRRESFGECGVTRAQEIDSEVGRLKGHALSASRSTVSGAEAASFPFVFDVATEADFEYRQFFGSAGAANQEIIGILNQVDGIYQAELFLQLTIVFQRVWETPTDPYTTSNASNALDEFSIFYEHDRPRHLFPRTIAHLWTGKDFTGSTVGIAYRPAVCVSRETSYGISQRLPSANEKVIVTAHEIGHNFNAAHPDQVTPTPPVGCENTIMNSSLGPSTAQSFCQFSRNEIMTHAGNVSSICLTVPSCTYALSRNLQRFGSEGGTRTFDVSTSGGCSWRVTEGAGWLSLLSANPNTGPSTVNYSVATNSGGPRQATVDVADRTLLVAQGASPNCAVSPIAFGQTINADLSNTDCRSGQPGRENAFIDLYSFPGQAGQRVRIFMDASPALADSFLYLFGPDGRIVAENDDIVLGVETDSRIPVNEFFTLPATGLYIIEATSFDSNATGSYSITLSDNSSTNSVSFDSPTYLVAEGTEPSGVGSEGLGFRTIVVNRSGDLSGTASVNFATSNGTADSRKDYTQTLGTLRFAANESQKSFRVLVNDDRFSEVNETVNLTLSNPVGTTLTGQTAAVLSVVSNDGATGPSPVREGSIDPAFFVRQQYHDFLSREPDLAGLTFWRDTATGCGQQDLLVCRINVSAAFFLSIEFQETGYLVYRIYKAAYGDFSTARPVPVRLDEFLKDTQEVRQGVEVGVGNWQAQLEANKVALASEFVSRSRFTTAFPPNMPPAQFVDQLNANAEGALSQSERDALINGMTTGDLTRSQVLRMVAEHETLRLSQTNKAFVLLQYFGYLRRNPDDAPNSNFDGWQFWFDKLTQFNGNFVEAEMVKAFLLSFEYIERFGT